MQSKRKEMKMELMSCKRRLQKLINKSTFKHCTNYSETLNAVVLENNIMKFDKPIYIGKYIFKFNFYLSFIIYRICGARHFKNFNVRLPL